MKKTILYIGGFELPDKNAAAHRVLNNGKMFKELGYNVVFIGIEKNSKLKSFDEYRFENVQEFDTYNFPYPQTSEQWIKYEFSVKRIKKVIELYTNIEGIVCYNLQSPVLFQLMKFSKQNNIKIIGDSTEWYGAQGSTVIKKAMKGLDSFVRMRILQKKMDGIIVISKFLFNYYNNKNKIIELPPLVDLTESKWKRTIDTEKKHSKKAIKLVYSGSPGTTKDNIKKVIAVLHKLRHNRDFIFTIIGITENDYLRLHPSDKRILGELEGKLFFLGRLSHLKSLEILKDADFSIFFREKNLTNNAGFPTKLVESFSGGIPVITNKNSNIDDYINSGFNGFIVENELEADLEYILNSDRENIDKIKSNVAKSSFDYNNFIEDFRFFLKKINL